MFVIARFYLNILWHVMINMVSPKLCIQYQYSCRARWYRIQSTTVVEILYDPNNRNTFCIRPISWHTGCSRGKSSYGYNQLIFLDPSRTLPRMIVLGPRRQVSSFLSRGVLYSSSFWFCRIKKKDDLKFEQNHSLIS